MVVGEGVRVRVRTPTDAAVSNRKRRELGGIKSLRYQTFGFLFVFFYSSSDSSKLWHEKRST